MVAVRDFDGNLIPATEEGHKVNEAHAAWQGRSLVYSLHPGEIKRRERAVSELYDMSHAGSILFRRNNWTDDRRSQIRRS